MIKFEKVLLYFNQHLHVSEKQKMFEFEKLLGTQISGIHMWAFDCVGQCERLL